MNSEQKIVTNRKTDWFAVYSDWKNIPLGVWEYTIGG
jgi:hypothetical protein